MSRFPAPTEADIQCVVVPVRARCFCGHRAVELSVKAVLIHHGVKFPFIHALQELIALVPRGVSEVVHKSANLHHRTLTVDAKP